MSERIDPRFLTAADAARYLSVSVQQFRRFVEKGILPAPVRRLGGEDEKTGERFVRWDRLALDAAVLGKQKADRERSIDDAIAEIKARQKDARRRNSQDLRV